VLVKDNDQYGHVDTCFENTREMQVIDGIDINRFFAAVNTVHRLFKDIELQWLVLQQRQQ
jgi:hypothetical protein